MLVDYNLFDMLSRVSSSIGSIFFLLFWCELFVNFAHSFGMRSGQYERG